MSDVSGYAIFASDPYRCVILDVITQLPSKLMIRKVRPSIFICCVTSAWGMMSMSQAFTRNFAGLFASRFILGVVEGMDSCLP